MVRCAAQLRLALEERDDLLLAAGFAPESAPAAVESQPDNTEEPLLASNGATEIGLPGRSGRIRYAALGTATLAIVIGVLGSFYAVSRVNDRPEPPTSVIAVRTPVPTEVADAEPKDDLAFPVAADGEWLIMMAPFVNYTGGALGYNVLGRLREAVDREIDAAGLADVRTAELQGEINGEAEAVRAGERSGAAIVIWGEYDSGRIKATFTVPRSSSRPHVQQVIALDFPSTELSSTINLDLTAEVKFAALMTLCELYYERNEFDRAKKSLLQAMTRPPSDSGALAVLRYRLGRSYQSGGATEDLDEAIWLFTQVLEVFPESLDTLNSRALAFLDRDREGDVNFAIEDLDRAARINRKHASTYVNRARAYLARGSEGDSSRALDDLSTAISVDPAHAEAYVGRASLYLERGAPEDLSRALEDVEHAKAIDPGLAPAYVAHGNIALRQNNYLAAISKFSRAISLDLSSSPAFFNRGLVLCAAPMGQVCDGPKEGARP